MPKLMTLVIVQRGGEVLLGMKKRGFGEGKWNGFGGKLAAGETIADAARREVREEAGIEVLDLTPCGLLTFHSVAPEPIEVHVFRSTMFSGEPMESEEMLPQWFAADALPFDTMWPDDRFWFPHFFAGKNFRGTFTFNAQGAITAQEFAVGEVALPM